MSEPFRLGYLVPEFPRQTHIFFWRECEELRKLGIEPIFLSIGRRQEPRTDGRAHPRRNARFESREPLAPHPVPIVLTARPAAIQQLGQLKATYA